MGGNIPDNDYFRIPIDWSQFVLDISIVKGFVTYGTPIFVYPYFVAVFVIGPCTGSYHDAMPAIHAYVMLNCENGLGFVVSHQTATEMIPLFHAQDLNLANASKDKGCLTSNRSGVSFRSTSSVQLNT